MTGIPHRNMSVCAKESHMESNTVASLSLLKKKQLV